MFVKGWEYCCDEFISVFWVFGELNCCCGCGIGGDIDY